MDAVVNPLVPGVHGFEEAVGGLCTVAVVGRVGLGDVLGGAFGVCFAVFAATGIVAGATAWATVGRGCAGCGGSVSCSCDVVWGAGGEEGAEADECAAGQH